MKIVWNDDLEGYSIDSKLARIKLKKVNVFMVKVASTRKNQSSYCALNKSKDRNKPLIGFILCSIRKNQSEKFFIDFFVCWINQWSGRQNLPQFS